MKTFAPCLRLPVQLFGCVLVTWFSILEYRPVSLIRSVRLFAPSLQWAPWPPLLPWPCGSPSSSVIWAHKIPHRPSPAISGCPRPPGALPLVAVETVRLSQVPREPFENVPRARDSAAQDHLRISVNPIQPSTENKSFGTRNKIDFGADSSRPTFSLPTLLFSTVACRKARLATGLLATALAGLDFHQLDSVERFHR
jgi:hypothetical protein